MCVYLIGSKEIYTNTISVKSVSVCQMTMCAVQNAGRTVTILKRVFGKLPDKRHTIEVKE